MKLALVNGERCEATPETKGICPVCGSVVVAKCGEQRVHHWAHKTKQNCNDRWEKEGPWHQNWKNKFPVEFQEKIIVVNNEKNIADVQTDKGLVIEFQHSHIKSEEQRARENAYKNMIWVVDGTRLKDDFPRFRKRIGENSKLFARGNIIKIFSVKFYDEVFPKDWINCSVPVIFDFLGLEKEENVDEFQKSLYFLLPRSKVKPDDFSAFLLALPRQCFLPLINNEWELFYPELLSNILMRQEENRRIAKLQTIYPIYRCRRRLRRNIF